MCQSYTNETDSRLKAIVCTLTLGVSALAYLPPVEAQTFFGSRIDGTLCTAGETIMFACDVKTKKVAVCARDSGSEAFASLHYRFGTPNGLDLSFPMVATAPPGFASGGDRGNLSRGSLVFLRMTNGETTYTVYHVAVSPTYTRIAAMDEGGILVERKGKLLEKEPCNHEQRVYAGMLDDPRFFGKAVPVDKNPVATFDGYEYRGD